jgi:fumarate reductase subunit D
MGFIAEGFFKWGLWSAKRPYTAIFMGVVLIIIGFTGFINTQTTVSK